MSASEFTLLIAGPWHESVNKMLSLCKSSLANIVLSTWQTGSTYVPSYPVKYVSSTLPGSELLDRLHNSQNIYLQAISVLAGLDNVDTTYTIKMRSDAYFSNLNSMIAAFNPDRLLTANIFVRDVSYKPFHISDHLFIGRTDRLKSAYSALKHYIEQPFGDPLGLLTPSTPAETKIGTFYLQSCGYEINQLVRLSENSVFDIMKNEIDIFDVDRL